MAEVISRAKRWILSCDWSYLTTWPFLLALTLLLLNDHVLKHEWPSAATGKLSDFAGLFTVAFLMAGRQVSTGRWLAVAGLVPFFVWWKSAASQSAISAWNDSAPFTIGRTVDPSDTIALVVLPVAVWAAASVQPLVRRRATGWGILGVAWAGILATSPSPVTIRAEPLALQYRLPISKAELLADLESRGEVAAGAAARSSGARTESFQVRAERFGYDTAHGGYGGCGLLEAQLDIGEVSGGAVVSPRKIKMDYHCVQTTVRDSVLAKFREYFLNRYQEHE